MNNPFLDRKYKQLSKMRILLTLLSCVVFALSAVTSYAGELTLIKELAELAELPQIINVSGTIFFAGD